MERKSQHSSLALNSGRTGASLEEEEEEEEEAIIFLYSVSWLVQITDKQCYEQVRAVSLRAPLFFLDNTVCKFNETKRFDTH